MMFLQGKRWFIWTLVFLLAAGVALVIYINLGDTSGNDSDVLLKHQPVTQKATPTKTTTPVKK